MEPIEEIAPGTQYQVWNQYGAVSPRMPYADAVKFLNRSNLGIEEKYQILTIEIIIDGLDEELRELDSISS